MVFAFDRPDLSVADNVRRAAREELDQAAAEVSETGFEVHETVRNVRRRLKRVRSLLRLVRPVFPAFAEENETLRQIGGEVSRLRDSQALVEAVDSLGGKVSPEAATALGRLRQRLRSNAVDHETALDRNAFLMDLRVRLREARVRSELWEFSGDGAMAMVRGLTATYRRARRSFRAAESAPQDDEAFHEWRKQLKYHWGHLKLLRGLAPAFADGRRRAAGRLSGMLGDIQNLHVLRDRLDLAGEDRALIEVEMSHRLGKLRRSSLKLGAALFEEKPSEVERRWTCYCADWQAAVRLSRD